MDNHISSVPAEIPVFETTKEDCINDPELGQYLPSYVPVNMVVERAEILYYLDSDTAEETGTKELCIEYRDVNDRHINYSVTVTWAYEYGQNGWAGPMIEAVELSAEAISDYTQKQKSSGVPLSYERINLGVWYDDVSVVISARGLSADTVYQIYHTINVE